MPVKTKKFLHIGTKDAVYIPAKHKRDRRAFFRRAKRRADIDAIKYEEIAQGEENQLNSAFRALDLCDVFNYQDPDWWHEYENSEPEIELDDYAPDDYHHDYIDYDDTDYSFDSQYSVGYEDGYRAALKDHGLK